MGRCLSGKINNKSTNLRRHCGPLLSRCYWLSRRVKMRYCCCCCCCCCCFCWLAIPASDRGCSCHGGQAMQSPFSSSSSSSICWCSYFGDHYNSAQVLLHVHCFAAAAAAAAGSGGDDDESGNGESTLACQQQRQQM